MESSTTDNQLMEAYVAGNESAFVLLFYRFSPKILLFIKLRLGKKRSHLLDEVIQKTWLKIHIARKTFDASKNFSGWIYSIALNTLRDEVGMAAEKWGHDEFSENYPDPKSTIEEEYILRESADRVYSVLVDLPENQKLALLMSDREEMSTKEIAAVLGMTDVAVRQLVSRARKSVRSRLMENN